MDSTWKVLVWLESREACLQDVCSQLPLASSTSSYPEATGFTGWWISGNSRACFCYVSRRLLKCSLCRVAEDDYRQAATSAQCCRPCGQWLSDTRKFDHGLTSLLHDELHWLDVPDKATGNSRFESQKFPPLSVKIPVMKIPYENGLYETRKSAVSMS